MRDFCVSNVFWWQYKKNKDYYAYYLEDQSILNFVVINVKHLNNGDIREYCTKGNFLLGALHKEYNLDYSKEELWLKKELNK